MTKDQVVSLCQNSLYLYPGPTPQLPPNLWNRLSMWLAEQGPPCGRVPGLLREGSRLYSYLRRGNITALKPHNLLPHPAASMFWRRPRRSPPTLATGHQSHREQLGHGAGGGVGERRQWLSKKGLCLPDGSGKPLVSESISPGTVADTVQLQAGLTRVPRCAQNASSHFLPLCTTEATHQA